MFTRSVRRSALALLLACLCVGAACRPKPVADEKPDPWKSVSPVRPVEVAWSAYYDAGDERGGRYDEARALALGPSGEVVVTGYSKTRATGEDCVTVLYRADGSAAWVDRYTEAGESRDRCYAVGFDAEGGVRVAGVTTREGRGLDFLAISFAPGGARRWVDRYDGPANGPDKAEYLAMLPDGGVLVAGRSAGEGTGDDMAVVRYDASGKLVWVFRHDGGESDHAGALVAAGDGGACLAGTSQGADAVVVRIDGTGRKLWAATVEAGRSVIGMGVDAAGAVYILGQTVDGDGRLDLTLAKFDADGRAAWTRARKNQDRDYEGGGLAVSSDGRATVSGDRDGYAQVVRYGSDGSVAWESNWLFGRTKDVATSADGGVIVTLVRDTGGGRELLTRRFDPDGGLAWGRVFAGPLDRPGAPRQFAVDRNGSGAAMTGFRAERSTRIDYATVRYRFP